MKNNMLIGLCFSIIAASAYASEEDGIFSYRTGRYEIIMMVERSNPGNAGILVGADQALLSRYIPAGGFNHSTNTFMIRAPGQNIIIDTGFGAAIFDKIRRLGAEPEQIDTVLLTHMHGDHIGGLQRDGRPLFPNAKLYVSRRESDHFTKTAVNQGAVAALAAYGSNVVLFDPPTLGSALREIVPGISPIAAYGHTPGHTVYLIQSGNERFLIIGDLLHAALVQFPRPDISATYDIDQAAAAVTRRQILSYAAQNRIPIGGMHMVYPAVGNVETDGAGFRFIPAR